MHTRAAERPARAKFTWTSQESLHTMSCSNDDPSGWGVEGSVCCVRCVCVGGWGEGGGGRPTTAMSVLLPARM